MGLGISAIHLSLFEVVRQSLGIKIIEKKGLQNRGRLKKKKTTGPPKLFFSLNGPMAIRYCLITCASNN